MLCIIKGLCKKGKTKIPTQAPNHHVKDAPALMDTKRRMPKTIRMIVPITTVSAPPLDLEFPLESQTKIVPDVRYNWPYDYFRDC